MTRYHATDKGLIPLTPEEEAEIDALAATVETRLKEEQAAQVRVDRNRRLTECDWTQLADSPLSPDDKLAWQLYRESLRTVPEQPGFPLNVEWPPVPGS